jgi:hypothetical protein
MMGFLSSIGYRNGTHFFDYPHVEFVDMHGLHNYIFYDQDLVALKS